MTLMLRWRRTGSRTDASLRYTAELARAGSRDAQAMPLVIEPLDSIMRGSMRIFEVRLSGRTMTSRTSLRMAKKVADNYLRLELDIALRGLSSLCSVRRKEAERTCPAPQPD